MGGVALPAGCRFVDAFVIDVNGVARGKRLPAADFCAAAEKGIAFSASCLVLDARGEAMGPLGIGTRDGDPDGFAQPVPGRIAPVPWAQAGVAQALLSMQREGSPLWYDPRQILAQLAQRLRADGLHPVVACELEFYLVHRARGGQPRPGRLPRSGIMPGHAGHLCLQRLEDHGEFLHALHDALALQGIDAGTLVSEYGPGQFEVNLRHTADVLAAADEAVLLKRAVLGVAAAHGLQASFMSKPYTAHPGSGMHVHVSLVDEAGANRFGGEGGQALLEQAVGGMRALHAQSMAFFAPNFSAWRRYRPGSFVSGGSDWGENSRAVAFRIPPGGAGSRRIEHRVAGADASPHLVLSAILAGLHHGISNGLAADAPVEPLPTHIFAALDALERGAELGRYLPENFASLYAELRRGETQALLAEPSAVEFDFYL